jgi:hypothetical protein
MPDAKTVRDAIVECFRAHQGGPMPVREVKGWIQRCYPRRWKDVATSLADLTIDGNESSTWKESERCLIRVARGSYRLAAGFLKDGDAHHEERKPEPLRIDSEQAAEAIRQFNRDPANLAADWLVSQCFPPLEKSRDPETIAERVVIIDGLWQTQLYRKPDVRTAIIRSLSGNWAKIWGALRTLQAEGDLLCSRNAVLDAARGLLGYVVRPEGAKKESYEFVFATKFFHWCTREHFPIIDLNARRGLRRIQVSCGVPKHCWVDGREGLDGKKQFEQYPMWLELPGEFAGPGMGRPRKDGLGRGSIAISNLELPAAFAG